MSTEVTVAAPWWRKLLSRASAGFPSVVNGPAISDTATFAYPLRGDSPAEYKRDGTTVRKKGFEQHPVVNACVRAVSDIIMAVPFETYRRAEDGEVTVVNNSPPQLLLDAPSPTVSSARLRHITTAHYLMYGNAFWHLARMRPGGPPVAIHIVHPEDVMAVYANEYGMPTQYQWRTDTGYVVTSPSADIVHFRDIPSGKTSIFGYPRAASALNDIVGDNEASQYVRQVVTNDGTPTLAMIVNEDTTQEEARVAEARWYERMVGRGQRGRTAFIGGVKDIKVIGFNLSDLEFPDLRRIAREDICAAFGVDPRMIGIGSASSDGGLSGIQYQEARVRLIQHTIEPIMETFVSEMNLWMMPEWGDWWVRFSPKRLAALVEDDRATSERVLKELSANARTLQEAREALGLPTEMDPFHTLVTNGMTQLMPVAIATPTPEEAEEESEAESPDDELDDDAMEAEGEGEYEDDSSEDAMASGDAQGMDASSSSVAAAEDVQAQALNGAQITALIDLLGQLASKQLPPDTVEALIKIAFPTIPLDLVTELMNGMQGFTPETTEPDSDQSVRTLVVTQRADDVTNFPEAGDNKKVSLRNSNYQLFPVAEAEKLKNDYPAIWRKGGNIRGNKQYAALKPIAERGGAADGEAEENAVRLREAWAARHEGDKLLAGVVAQVKWLVVGSRGLDHMRAVLSEAKAKEDERKAHVPSRFVRSSRGAQLSRDQRKLLWQQFDARASSEEADYKRNALMLFAEERASVDKIFSVQVAAATNAKTRAKKVGKAGNMEKDDPYIDAAMRRIKKNYRPGGEYHRRWLDRYQSLIGKTYSVGASELASSMGISFTLENPKVQQAIRDRAERLATYVGDTSSRQITRVVAAGRKAGMGIGEISRLVNATVYGGMASQRATMIARTETVGALNQGEFDLAATTDARTKEWLTQGDDRVREDHELIDGQRIPMDEPFPIGVLYPGDQTGDAEQVINCRCTLLYYDD